jgi:hypothetical protein
MVLLLKILKNQKSTHPAVHALKQILNEIGIK